MPPEDAELGTVAAEWHTLPPTHSCNLSNIMRYSPQIYTLSILKLHLMFLG